MVHRNYSAEKNPIDTLVVDNDSDEVKKEPNILLQDEIVVEEYGTFDVKPEMATQTQKRPYTSHGLH